MKKSSLIATTALGMAVGAVLFNAPRAYAQWATIDVAAIAQLVKSVAAETGILDAITAMQTVQQTMSDTMKAVNTALGTNTYGDTNTLLMQGFTQNANYSKAQISAIQGIADASNTANARFSRDMRNAQIRDEQTASPDALCCHRRRRQHAVCLRSSLWGSPSHRRGPRHARRGRTQHAVALRASARCGLDVPRAPWALLQHRRLGGKPLPQRHQRCP